jgi:hypothetical protein
MYRLRFANGDPVFENDWMVVVERPTLTEALDAAGITRRATGRIVEVLLGDGTPVITVDFELPEQ